MATFFRHVQECDEAAKPKAEDENEMKEICLSNSIFDDPF